MTVDTRPTFGSPLHQYRKCAAVGCDWHVFHGLMCVAHGGRVTAPEWRTDEWGGMQWRRGYEGPVIPALRKES